MDLCSNKYCPKKEDCGRTRKEYFGAMLEVLKDLILMLTSVL
ncbi:hypothetical protein BSPWISOXPB_4105 [uncultured Gammaproteobacteria bacterium]|nr:hypothetical protein BSPWISOXPB_4105 [uncultured Gammaproteobacteria bacterium]